MTTAFGSHSHAEGQVTTASKPNAHAEGFGTTADGYYSHAEGDSTVASGNASHAEGQGTIAVGENQHVQGKYNIKDVKTAEYPNGKYAHMVGNGTSDYVRSNAHTLDWNGNAWFAGNISSGKYSSVNTSEFANKNINTTSLQMPIYVGQFDGVLRYTNILNNLCPIELMYLGEDSDDTIFVDIKTALNDKLDEHLIICEIQSDQLQNAYEEIAEMGIIFKPDGYAYIHNPNYTIFLKITIFYIGRKEV